MIVKEFKLEHLENFTPQNSKILDIKGDLDHYITSVNCDTVTFIRDDRVIAICGVSYLRRGVGEVWLIPGVLVDKYKLEFFKITYRLIHNFLIPQMRLHRTIIAIKEGWEQGYKWAKALGFKYESMMEAYDTSYGNQACFVRITKWQKEQ